MTSRYVSARGALRRLPAPACVQEALLLCGLLAPLPVGTLLGWRLGVMVGCSWAAHGDRDHAWLVYLDTRKRREGSKAGKVFWLEGVESA